MFVEYFRFSLFLQFIQHSLRKIIMHWYRRTIAYQFWFLKLEQHFRYLDLNPIFLHLQVAPSVANLFKHTIFVWTVWRTNQNWQSLKETLSYIYIWHDTSKPVFCLISNLMTEHHSHSGLAPFVFQSSLDKMGKVKGIQSFNHVCLLFVIFFTTEEK